MERLSCLVAVLLFANLTGCFGRPRPEIVVRTMSVETQLYLIDATRLEDQVVPAITDFLNDGNPARAEKLLQEALTSESFQALTKSNPVLADYFAQGSRDLLNGKLPEELVDDTTGQATRDFKRIRQRETEVVLTHFLVLYWCARYPRGTSAGITLNRGALANYIRSQSRWVDEMLSLSNNFLWDAQDLTPRVGTDAKLLTPDQSGILLAELMKVPPPRDLHLNSQYEELKRLLEAAVRNQHLRILICTG